MDKTTTKKLEEILMNVKDEKSLNTFVKTTPLNHPLMSFAEYLEEYMNQKNRSRSDICRDSGIERTYFYHILAGSKNPGRDKILRICIAAKMNVEETQKALRCGLEAELYAKNMHDAVLLFSLQHQLSVMDTNELLNDYQLPILE